MKKIHSVCFHVCTETASSTKTTAQSKTRRSLRKSKVAVWIEGLECLVKHSKRCSNCLYSNIQRNNKNQRTCPVPWLSFIPPGVPGGWEETLPPRSTGAHQPARGLAGWAGEVLPPDELAASEISRLSPERYQSCPLPQRAGGSRRTAAFPDSLETLKTF